MRPEAPGMWAKDLMIPNFAIFRNCRHGGGGGGVVRVVTPWRALGGGKIHTQEHHLPQDCWSYQASVQGLFIPLCWGGKGSFITDNPPGPTWSPFTTCRVMGVSIITQILHGGMERH